MMFTSICFGRIHRSTNVMAAILLRFYSPSDVTVVAVVLKVRSTGSSLDICYVSMLILDIYSQSYVYYLRMLINEHYRKNIR